jgi:hypothetical protein
MVELSIFLLPKSRFLIVRVFISYSVLTSALCGLAYFRLRDSVIGIVTRLRSGRSRVRISARPREFLFFRSSRPALKPNQLPIHWVAGFFPGGGGVKWPRRDVEHSPPCSADIKRVELYFYTPHMSS